MISGKGGSQQSVQQLSQALSDVSGETGQAMIRAIVAGERDPHQLATLRNYQEEMEIAKESNSK